MPALLSKSIIFLLLSSLVRSTLHNNDPLALLKRRASIMSDNSNSNYKEFLDTLPIALEKARADGGIPGMSVAILYKGELVFAQGFGKRNRKEPFTEEVNKQRGRRMTTVCAFFDA